MKHVLLALVALACVLTASPLRAQVGNNNPAGQSGIFNGQVGGCGYDPYTGNASRSITDIAVAGAVGEYPLALVRAANSRTPSITGVFGWQGGWNHSYNWTMDDSPVANTQNSLPKKYTVNFPDGRVETFRAVTWDTVYRVRPGADTPQTTSSGIRERLLQLNLSNMYAYLILPDGGAVEFRAQQNFDPNYGRYWYTYRVTGIYDPYGLKTTIDSEVVGTIRRITRVTEPAGRYLQFSYDPNDRRRITQVTEYINGMARRIVQYSYNGLGWLTSVLYYGNSAWTARYQYTGSNVPDMPMLLSTCDDPMYPGPMKRIAYEYKPGGPNDPNNPDGTRPVYGQILRERYWDGVSAPTAGVMVSELTVGESPNITYKRKETRGDGDSRTFIYDGGGYVNWVPDFMGHSAQQHYDAVTKYVDYVVDRRGNRTDYTSDPVTGNVTQVQFPLTQGDTTGQNQRPTVNYTYTNSYYLHTIQDEGNHTTTFTRNGNNRVTRIDYPDDGYETFGYDASHFYQISSHRMTTGGTESWTYDARHRNDTYRNPDNASGNPTARYLYDNYDRLSDITDVLGASAGDQNHTTSFDYNLRGQITVTTLPQDPVDNVRHTVRNSYNDTGNNAGDGTLVSTTDQLNHTTTYTHDDYHRVKSVAPPVRGSGDNGTYTTSFYYGANPWDGVNDYKLTDSNVSYVVPPSTGTKKIKTVYDDNRRKQSIILAPGTAGEATISYGYDNADNLTTVTNPRNLSVIAIYDERNRPSEIHDPYNNITSFTYDTAGRRKTITRPNGQVITNASFDEMNRVLQQNVTQTPGPLAVTKYTYYPSGLLNTMTDPFNSTDSYVYTYDLTGRKSWVIFPAGSNGVHSSEHFTYDAAGRLDTFKNRSGNTQTFSYDALNRMTQSSWNDNGTTPTVTLGYDAASRLTAINNANANISRTYFDDNLLRQETETITGGSSKTVAYTYDADGNRANITYPDYAMFAYTYSLRNQLKTVGSWATYTYDENGYTGDLTTCALNNSTSTTYNYDPLDRVTWITHRLTNGVRGFNYGYDDVSVGNRKYVRRTGTTLGDKGDAFSYDVADQAIGVGLNVTTPQSTPAPARSIFYDANGNRTTFRPYGPTDTYVTNNLNQYTSRNSNNATYNGNGDMTVTPEPAGSRSTYSFDAQNRLTSAGKGNVTVYFNYDGLNRQVSRTVGGVTTYNVWNGWNLIEEYQSGGTVTAKYVYGTRGLIKELVNNRYYYQDGSGSTSHLADGSGNLKEWYRYDLQGTPVFYNLSDQQISSSAFNVRHLLTGQEWYQQVGLYDLRNRFYSPDLGRFLQPDPIGFRGDRTNLYRYCRNNPVTRLDRFGLQDATVPEVRVTGTEPIEPSEPSEPIDHSGTGAPSGGGGGGGAGEGGGNSKLIGVTFSYGKPPANSDSNTQQQPGIMVGFDIYHPQTTAEFIIAGNIIEHGDTTDTTPEIDLISLFSGGVAGLTRSSISSIAVKGISTPYGPALQSTTAEAQAALRQIRAGATVYKGGVLGRSETSASQFLSLESPLNQGYAGRYGIPIENSNFNFILSGKVRPGAPLITRPAAGVPSYGPQGVEGVTTPGSFIIDSFYMPD